MTTFRNGYHFVPRAPNNDQANGRALPLDPRSFGLRLGHESEGHAIYAGGAHSGRICCRITLECPTIIGSTRQKDTANQTPALVAPFLFDGRPGVPATSLKGMLSNVAEAAARAPYRVLSDMRLTVAYSKRLPSNGKLLTVRHRSDGDRSSVDRPELSGPSNIKNSHAYFDPSLLPLHIKDGTIQRALVNPVESMFGFVAETAKGQTKPGRGKVNSAAGKLRPSHALPSGGWLNAKVADFYLDGTIDSAFDKVPPGVRLTLLKEQGEPMKKPKRQADHVGKTDLPDGDYGELRSATPNFYFYDRRDPQKFITKEDFATGGPSKYAAQGAKFYLHNAAGTISEPWVSERIRGQTEGIERKAAAPVMKAGVTLDFHIDFDNLLDHELNILCFALRPTPRFRHKIGLGKGLGLGSIRIDVTDLILIDRKARYTAAALLDDDPRAAVTGAGKVLAESYATNHKTWLEQNDKPALTALLAIGETHDFDGQGGVDATIPVLWVPLTDEKYSAHQMGDAQAEDKSFQWFTLNDKANRQKLAPITSNVLPTLKTIPEPPHRPRRDAAHAPIAPQPAKTPVSAAGTKRGTVTKISLNQFGKLFAFISEDVSGTSYYASNSEIVRARLTDRDAGAHVTFIVAPDPVEPGKASKVTQLSRA